MVCSSFEETNKVLVQNFGGINHLIKEITWTSATNVSSIFQVAIFVAFNAWVKMDINFAL